MWLRVVLVLAATVQMAGPAAAGPAPDCEALHWRLVSLLEEATAALFEAARLALVQQGVPEAKREAVLRYLREPEAAQGSAPEGEVFRRHFAAFEQARREVLEAAGCADAGAASRR